MMDDDDVESVPLARSSNSRTRRLTSNKVVWIITGSILLFSFFAFVFATASFAATKTLKTGVSNNFYNQQGGLIQQEYGISPVSLAFDAGTVLSFCDGPSNVCPGLGPRWSSTLSPPGSLTPAVEGGLVQLTADLAVYAWAAMSTPNILRVVAIRTTGDPAYAGPLPTTVTFTEPISYINLQAYNSNSFVISYNLHNTTYLVGGIVGGGTTPVQLGASMALFNVSYATGAFEIDLLVLESTWILVSYGSTTSGASFLAYALSGTTLTPLPIKLSNGYGIQITNQLTGLDLGSTAGINYFLHATGDKVVLGSVALVSNTLTLSTVKTWAFSDVIYETISATNLFNGYIAIAGVQTDYLDVPLTISMVLQWSTQAPYLTGFHPSNLLETQDHQLLDFQLSSCFIPPSGTDKQGELFYAYVDRISDKAKIIRAKIAITGADDVQLLPSPPIDIATFKYSDWGTGISPLLSCPSSSGVLVAFQYLGTYFNTFIWEGGYRFAGIAQESYSPATSKTAVTVLRQGISPVHSQLQAGYSYYLTNSGQLQPHTSLTEMFTPTSYATRVGVAISDSQLLLDPLVFEAISNEA